ncbi:hypothetical protein VNO78_03933 [Psophocarpus tetragonolobus]|uniref:Uncharacterized protein n=1 Tax=Psophocarpus tetragonolobus TaxID=3891 RepID=A0AAN9XXE1_PSOTE
MKILFNPWVTQTIRHKPNSITVIDYGHAPNPKVEIRFCSNVNPNLMQSHDDDATVDLLETEIPRVNNIKETKLRLHNAKPLEIISIAPNFSLVMESDNMKILFNPWVTQTIGCKPNSIIVVDYGHVPNPKGRKYAFCATISSESEIDWEMVWKWSLSFQGLKERDWDLMADFNYNKMRKRTRRAEGDDDEEEDAGDEGEPGDWESQIWMCLRS